jgi:hypothetical protein
LRALNTGRSISPETVRGYLESKFGDALDEVYEAMKELAKSLTPSELAEKAYPLYEKFRPEILPGKRGWGPQANWIWKHSKNGSIKEANV